MITAKSIGTGGLGRMGNQMFTIAGCIGIAVKSGQPYAFPPWLNHDNKIFGGDVDDIGAQLVNDWPLVPESINFYNYGYFWGYREINLPTGNWSIDAHMQSEKFFSHCLPLIRKIFTFKDQPEQNEYVAVHFRAGDYQEGDDCHHPRCNKEYYQKAMALFPNEIFKVFTDDTNAWAQTMGASYNGTGCNHGYIEDFKRMKSCKSFITANSSYSLMAAILGAHPEKKIVCPQRWFGNSMPEPYKSETMDLYPQGAIIL